MTIYKLLEDILNSERSERVLMAKNDKLDRKLKRCRAALAHYKRQIKDAERELKYGHISKEKCAKLKQKYEGKKSKVITKMKKLKQKAKGAK